MLKRLPQKFSRGGGFTFLEVLLGVLMFSIISLSLYSTFASGIQINRRSEKVGRLYQEARWTVERIAHDLENMRPYDFSNSYPELSACEGEEDAIAFLIAASDGLRVVRYFLGDPKTDKIYKVIIGAHQQSNKNIMTRYEEKMFQSLLVREERPFVDYLQASLGDNTARDILSPHVKEGSLKFSYAYLEGQGENIKTVWKNIWRQKYLPAGVRITLTLVSSEKSQGPLTITRDVYIPIGFLVQEMQ